MDERCRSDIAELLSRHLGNDSGISGITPVSGGCINACYIIDAGGASFFIKMNAHPVSKAMFEAEFKALTAMREQKGIKVPEPLLCAELPDASQLLLTEALELGGRENWALFAEGLVALHNIKGPKFGWAQDNYIGTTAQSNKHHTQWHTFWWQERLLPQLHLAYDNGYRNELQGLESDLRAASERLLENHHCQASLVHGDLWSGNTGFCQNGSPALYDPACYFGDREVDLALSQLFGGFSPNFIDSYQQHWPLPPGYKQRFELYNLYHLLNHLNLFGSTYLSQCVSTIRHLSC